jgi:type I restriction enzyme, S subunit
MSRLKNARTNHLDKWVLPTASRLLIDGARKGAATKPLKQVAYIEMGQSPVGDCYNRVQSGVPFIGGPADLGLIYPEATRWIDTPTKLCKRGDIIICVRATIGEPRWADTVYCLGRGVAGVRACDPELDQGFLFRIIQGSEDYLREQGTGTTFKTISKEHIESIQVPMIPLDEQQAISTFLRWIETAEVARLNISEAPKLPEILQKQRQVVIRIEELSAKIEEARTLRSETSKRAEAMRESIVKALFSDLNHSLEPLGNAASIARGKFSFRPRNAPQFYGGRFPFIQIGDISNSNIVVRSYSQTLNEDGLRISRLFPKGTVVIAITGATIGATGILSFESCFPDSIVGINAKPGIATSEFIYWALEYAKRSALAEATQTTQPNINLQILERLRIPIPPMAEQQRIVAYLDDLQSKVDSVKTLQKESEKELNVLMPSILSRAFAGKL